MARAIVAMILLVASVATTTSPSAEPAPVCGPVGNLSREASPMASRNGRVLVWVRWTWRDDDSRVFVSALDGSGAKPVSVPRGGLDVPSAIAPDGSEVLISRYGQPYKWILASTLSSTARFVDEPEVVEIRRRWRTPEWSPDGRFVLQAKDDGVWVAASDGGSRRRVSNLKWNSSAAWSPDGKRIVFDSGDESQTDPRSLRGERGRNRPSSLDAIRSVRAGVVARRDLDRLPERLLLVPRRIGARPDQAGRHRTAPSTRRHQGPDQREASGVGWVDATRLVFTSYQHEHDGPHKLSNIHTIGVDGRGERRVTYHCHLGTRRDDVLQGSILGDTMRAFAGGDVVIPGPGGDDVDTGTGADLVWARDGERDLVRCGPGRDTVLADRRDVVRGCERILRR